MFSDYSDDTDENKKALSRLIQSAIDSQDHDNQKALEWIENLVENGCNYWFNRTLKQMNNTIENNTTCRVCYEKVVMSHLNLIPNYLNKFLVKPARIQKVWGQLVQSVRNNATVDQIKDGFSNVRIPIIESNTDGLRVSLDDGPKISELKDEHIMLVEWDENILNLIRPKR